MRNGVCVGVIYVCVYVVVVVVVDSHVAGTFAGMPKIFLVGKCLFSFDGYDSWWIVCLFSEVFFY